jgi:cytochrome c oxidase subunit 2
MIGTVYVMQQADYQAWLGGARATAGGSLVQRGEALFTQLACVTCHLPDGTGRGPSLEGLYGSQVTLDSGAVVTADESYLRESILMSQAKTVKGYERLMPTFQGLINEDGVAALIEYIKSMQAAGNRVASAQ